MCSTDPSSEHLAVQSYPVLVSSGVGVKDYIVGYDGITKNVSTTIRAGYWNPNNKKWNNVGSVGYAKLSRVNENDNVYEVKWNNDNANINRNNQKFPSPFVACEHCCEPCFSGVLFVYSVMDQLLLDIFQAYYDARCNKRNTVSQLEFELNFEHSLFELHKELVVGTYTIGPSICFIISDPVKREVFASSFRDRVVHHLVYNYIYDFFDRHFIHDSYSCRLGKGTHYGIRRLDHFIRSCSQNYTKDCYILKLDIQGFFMNIDKEILKQKITEKLTVFECLSVDKQRLLRLIYQIIDHDSTQNYVFRGNISDYDGLPKEKSLFHSGANKGLPIGNLTSQLFANIYLDDFDKFMKYSLGLKYYGRYVDDFFIVHQDKDFLKALLPQIRQYLTNKLELTLHPNKIYLQHYSRGVKFLGAYIKPWRTYIHRRTLGNFKKKMKNLIGGLDKKDELNVINSYLGILRHGRNFTLRKNILGALSDFSFDEHFICGKIK